MKIGLYFGSFNPVHNGHLIIANHLAQNTDLEQIWLVVSPHNPHKSSNSLLNEYNRLYFVQISVEEETGLKESNIEFKLPKPSYTADTLQYLSEKYPEHEFSIIMGSDSYQNLENWKNYQYIENHHKIYIYQRPGFIVENLKPNAQIVNAPLLDISSTQIRTLIKAGKSIRYLVPDRVLKEIVDNGYYK